MERGPALSLVCPRCSATAPPTTGAAAYVTCRACGMSFPSSRTEPPAQRPRPPSEPEPTPPNRLLIRGVVVFSALAILLALQFLGLFDDDPPPKKPAPTRVAEPPDPAKVAREREALHSLARSDVPMCRLLAKALDPATCPDGAATEIDAAVDGALHKLDDFSDAASACADVEAAVEPVRERLGCH